MHLWEIRWEIDVDVGKLGWRFREFQLILYHALLGDWEGERERKKERKKEREGEGGEIKGYRNECIDW